MRDGVRRTLRLFTHPGALASLLSSGVARPVPAHRRWCDSPQRLIWSMVPVQWSAAVLHGAGMRADEAPRINAAGFIATGAGFQDVEANALPPHDDRENTVQLGQGRRGGEQQAAPDHRTDAQPPHFQLQDRQRGIEIPFAGWSSRHCTSMPRAPVAYRYPDPNLQSGTPRLFMLPHQSRTNAHNLASTDWRPAFGRRPRRNTGPGWQRPAIAKR